VVVEEDVQLLELEEQEQMVEVMVVIQLQEYNLQQVPLIQVVVVEVKLKE